MGKEKYIRSIEELFKRSPVVSSRSIERIVTYKKKSGYAKQLVRNLISKGKIKRIAKGYYTAHDDASLAVFCLKPAYLGLHDALSFHGIWEQETIPVIITARKARQGLRKVIGMNVLVRRISGRYLFGLEYSSGEFCFPYSDIEKTFIDLVYFNQKLSKELIKEFKKRMDIRKLKSYLGNYPPMISSRALRYLC